MNSSTSLPSASRKYSAVGERAQADAQARARRLGHLSVDQRCARLARVAGDDDAALLELEPEVVPLARPFADAAEHRHAAVLERDVVDQLLDDDRLADAGAAEQADLAALQVRLDQVDDLDAGLEHLQLGGLLRRAAAPRGGSASAPSRSPAGPGSPPGGRARSARGRASRGPTGTVIGSPRSMAVIPRCMPSVGSIATARTRFSPRCCSTSTMTSIGVEPSPPVGRHADRVVDRRQVAVLELDVDDGADDRDDLAGVLRRCLFHSVISSGSGSGSRAQASSAEA